MGCCAFHGANLLGKKWTIALLQLLERREAGFNEILHSLDASPKVLSARLKELESMGIVERPTDANRKYRLTKKGKALGDIIEQLDNWNSKYMKN